MKRNRAWIGLLVYCCQSNGFIINYVDHPDRRPVGRMHRRVSLVVPRQSRRCVNRSRPSPSSYYSHHSIESEPKLSLNYTTNDERGGQDGGFNTTAYYDNSSSSSSTSWSYLSRRSMLQQQAVVLLTTTATSLSGLLSLPSTVSAGKPELDSRSGQLYTPKSEMLRGGSSAARGIAVSPDSRPGRRPVLQPGQVLQNIYSPRFIAYLSRFLLNFDPSAHSWWISQGVGDTWEETLSSIPTTSPGRPSSSSVSPATASSSYTARVEETFAEFAESVELGLSDYFAGPYGSYSNLAAMTAGLNAAQPARSQRASSSFAFSLLSHPWENKNVKKNGNNKRSSSSLSPLSSSEIVARQGILNLYTLLKARYTSIAAKKQLAILFSFISPFSLQPTTEIAGLLGEADNATLSRIQLQVNTDTGLLVSVDDEAISRTSPLRGGGYSVLDEPLISIDEPPALGDDYPGARARPVMQSTSRVLKIVVTDPGSGYWDGPPSVRVLQNGIRRACQACAIINRHGQIESILVLDPGYGYGIKRDKPPLVQIDPPLPSKKQSKQRGPLPTLNRSVIRPAKAVALLEYKIVDVDLRLGGAGYVKSEPPRVSIAPPAEDPDWFVNTQQQPELRMVPLSDEGRSEGIHAIVTEMRQADGNVVYSLLTGASQSTPRQPLINDKLLERIQRDPLELLPLWVRPERTTLSDGDSVYTVPILDAVPQVVAVISPRYRAFDPVFGGVGKVPVTKGALELSASEYARLAFSGAVCTVVVRTLLNPLELVKTKQQLKNDPKLLNYVIDKNMANSKDIQVQSFDYDNLAKENDSAKESDSVTDLGRLSVRDNRRAATLAVTSATKHLQIMVEEKSRIIPRAPSTIPVSRDSASVSTLEMLRGIVDLRGPLALFQSADITFLASLAFGSFGFGATELFRRSFTSIFFTEDDKGENVLVLLAAASLATILTAAVAAPLELLRVRSMGQLEPTKWTNVLQKYMDATIATNITQSGPTVWSLRPADIAPLWSGFGPTLSRELPFAIAKFLTFDLIARTLVRLCNAQAGEGAVPIQVGVGTLGLVISAFSGAVAGVAGAIVSHPADLYLTKTSACGKSNNSDDWKTVFSDLVSQEGGIANLFVGLGARSTFFFLVIGLQFFLYDYVKNLFEVGSDDLSLVLDVFYAVRAGLSTFDKSD